MATKGWVNVSKANLCAICGKNSWCTISEDGETACCMRLANDRPMKNGGYRYRLTEPIPKYKLKPKAKPKAVPLEHMPRLSDAYRLKCEHPVLLANSLGVSVEALLLLGVGYDGHNWTFPMRDADEKIVGIHLRASSGKKWCVSGSHLGLFWPASVSKHDDSLLVICEGATDCAAILDMGFHAIGRPSNTAAVETVESFLRAKRRDVLIMSDKDEVKDYAGGRARPGIAGAHALAERISKFTTTCKIIHPPRHKDIRSWYQAGATKAAVMALAKSARVCLK